jgi:hypothetical protein
VVVRFGVLALLFLPAAGVLVLVLGGVGGAGVTAGIGASADLIVELRCCLLCW